MWFNLTTAQWLRRCGYLRYTSGFVFRRLASEFCYVYSSQYFKEDFKQFKAGV
jgi:hypothetical protein